MDTKVNELKQLFYYLDKRGITPKTLYKKLVKWNLSDIIDLYDEIFAMTPYSVPTEEDSAKHQAISNNLFDFYASPVLSGGETPCSGLECRTRTADQLARFVALYSDHVLILHPLYDRRHELKSEFAGVPIVTAMMKQAVDTDFSLLFYYRPLLEAGIVGITPHRTPMCVDCQREAIEAFDEIEVLVNLIAKSNRRKFSVQYGRDEYDGLPSVTIDGPDEFIPHPIVYTLFNERKEYKKRNNTYWITQMIYGSLSGILYPYWSSYSYLTSYTPDITVLNNITTKKLPQVNTSLLDGLSHYLPFIYDVPFHKLLELRKKEGEAFQVYRDSLRLALKSADSVTGNQSREIFTDIVLPELNKIDNTIKNSRKILKRNLTEDLLIGAGKIGLGLFAGLVSPTFGACLAVLGGVDFASGLIKQANHILAEPANIRDSGYYFLWKVRQETTKY